jgi:hypothetical protein
MFNKLKEFLYLDHRPIQVFLATLWFFYGLMLVSQNIPFVEHPIDHSDLISPKIEGVLLLIVAGLGYLGALKKSLKTDFVFAAFSLYKNSMAAISVFLISGFEHSWWVNEVAQALASMLLLNKILFNLQITKHQNSKLGTLVER